MKKLVMLAAVLLGTAAASQAGIDIRIGLPLPPLPRVVIGYPAPVVVAPNYCQPVYGYGHRSHGHVCYLPHRSHNTYPHAHRAHYRGHSHGRDYCNDGRRGRR